MRSKTLLALSALVVGAFALAAAPAVGPATSAADPAPGFTLTDTNGNTHRLIDFRGQTVVLEWLNYDCPFVRKHYSSGNMQRLQEQYRGQNVVWLAVVSSAPGQQGHFSNADMNQRTTREGGKATAVLMDPTGQVGRSYGARTTPHMFVINPQGQIVYNGAIDDKPTTAQADIATARNYLAEAVDATLAGRAVPTARTQPYGCSVKYATAS